MALAQIFLLVVLSSEVGAFTWSNCGELREIQYCFETQFNLKGDPQLLIQALTNNKYQ